MIELLEAFLQTNVGVGQITVDGLSIKYERAQALAELQYWKTKAAQADGTRRKTARINLDTTW